MILLLLTYSTSWSQNNIEQDSVLVPLSAIKVANAKMIELEYEKQINIELNNVIKQDSLIIDNLYNTIYENNNRYNNNIDKLVKERNTATLVGGSTSVILFIILILSI